MMVEEKWVIEILASLVRSWPGLCKGRKYQARTLEASRQQRGKPDGWFRMCLAMSPMQPGPIE
jgi:hypothetical protein